MAEALTIYFVRHGETDWNFVRRYQGQTDVPLNERGRAQAARNGRVLAQHLGADAAALDYVASPLVRARETMEIVRRELGLPPEGYAMDDRLREIHFGHWEGRIWDDLPNEDADGFAARKADPWGWQPEGGESYRMLSARVAEWLREVERDTAVVSHGGVSRALRGLLLQLAPAAIPGLEVPQDRVLVIRRGSAEWL
jgi:probable phosphoglycerate mutase